MRVKVYIAIFLGAFLSCFPSLAKAKPESPTSFQHRDCFVFAKKNGWNDNNVYIAWVAGLGHACFVSDFPFRESWSEVLNDCEKYIKDVRKIFGFKEPCTLVVDRGKIVDSSYKDALSLWSPWPISVAIFDSLSGTGIDRSTGTYFDYPTKYSGKYPVEWHIELRAEGILICDGTAAIKPGSFKVRYSVDCFGEIFKGSSKLTKVVRNRGLILIAPEKVRIESKGSWIEIEF